MPTKTNTRKTSTKKKWTVMAYMAGDNNLDSAGVIDLKEMKKAGSTDDVNIIAQFDRCGADVETQRYYLRKGGTLEKDVVAALGETNCGDPNVLQDFIEWGVKNYPAEHYMLVLWNHGAGWNDENVYRLASHGLRMGITRRGIAMGRMDRVAGRAVPMSMVRSAGGKRFRRAFFRTTIERALSTRAICFDDNAKDFLDNLEMKKVLTSARKKLKRKIDILGMDACLMNMAEVAYQVRNSIGIMAGSEESEPNNGWPYDKILGALVKKPGMSAAELSGLIVKEYLASYTASEGVTQSALDLEQCQALQDALNRLGRSLKDSLANETAKTAIMTTRNKVQSYDTDYIDLLDFCGLIEKASDGGEIKTACAAVSDAAGKFILTAGCKGNEVSNSCGVSIYFPTDKVSPLYAKLDFARKGAWDEFLKAYIDATRSRA